jgi:asparagine synthase (glutamine-hydrolysing)
MCGILFGIGNAELVSQVINFAKVCNKRGPDGTITESICDGTIQYLFHRLAIQGNTHDARFIKRGNVLLLCNGEVYPTGKFKSIYSPHNFTNGESDCDWIIDEYVKDLNQNNSDGKIRNDSFRNCIELLENSEFALVILDLDRKYIHVARDRFGIRPLFKIVTNTNDTFYSSELKYIPPFILKDCKIEQVKPNSWNTFSLSTNSQDPLLTINDMYGNMQVEFYDNLIRNEINSVDVSANTHLSSLINGLTQHSFCLIKNFIKSNVLNILPEIREKLLVDGLYKNLYESVKDRIDYCDAEIGYLLSGGLDSSIIDSIAARIVSERNGKKIRTFAIGMDENATDIIAAKEVAEFIGSDHTTVIMSKEKFLEAINEVIYIEETWDVTTIRAGVGMYLISKWIRENTNIRVLITGEGSDELFGSYRYFLNAPFAEAHYEETTRLLNDIHYFDVLRCDRTISNNSIEARVPFLDSRVVNFVNFNFRYEDYTPKKGLMKFYLREVARIYNLLPENIYYRPKEAFSDGVSKLEESWHEIIRKHYIANPYYFQTDEKIIYSMKFNSMYDMNNMDNKSYVSKIIPYQWLPKWSNNEADPSARNLTVSESYSQSCQE